MFLNLGYVPGRGEPLAPVGKNTQEEVAHVGYELRGREIEDGDLHPAPFVEKQVAQKKKIPVANPKRARKSQCRLFRRPVLPKGL